MGEDDDEQTGNYYKLPPPAKSTHDTDGQDQDKPKYKRQEFMRYHARNASLFAQ